MRYLNPVTTYDAILPAGGEIDEGFASKVGTKNKALIRFGNETILERTIRALRDSGKVRRIAVIGPKEVHDRIGDTADLKLDPGTTGPDNILRGLEALSKQPDPTSKVIVCTTDLPFLNGELVASFLESCPQDVAICLPVVSKATYQARFTDSSSTFIPLRDGVWTAGCLYLLDSDALRSAKPYIDKIFEVRKSKIGMARLLGPAFVCKFVAKQLTIADLERKIVSLLKCSGKAVLNSPPELAYDIDDEEDYRYAMEHAT
jgi:GTP:adenosylcobinamide-phosphate guanylyltransferase